MHEASQANRKLLLANWAKEKLSSRGFVFETPFELAPVSDDASFRRYFRVESRIKSQIRNQRKSSEINTANKLEGGDWDSDFIFVDAPPEHEDSASFVKIAQLISSVDVCAPEVIEYDLELGFMMLTDLGDRLFLDLLGSNESHAHAISTLYPAAFEILQKFKAIDCHSLPQYDEGLLRTEMDLFPEWLLGKQLDQKINEATMKLLSDVFNLMVENAMEQPRVFVHRDFHSRNLMFCEDDVIGVIDFQDGVMGPVTYDLVSLLKDCYWCFPRDQVVNWVKIHWQTLAIDVDFPQFLRWFDFMGMQRHIKCAGIFCRLSIRDGKPAYIEDIPQVLRYLIEVCEVYAEQYEELRLFGIWLNSEVAPHFEIVP